MQIFENTYPDYKPLYSTDSFCSKDKILFIDIETTGLSKEKTTLYLIGCGYYTENDFKTILYFADNPAEELDVLNAYIDFSKSFTHLIHFNGTKFDIPYLQFKARKYGLNDPFSHINQIDVYQLAKPLRYLLFPQSMRQKCIEDFLKITRNDMYNGGELIEVYHSYVNNPNDSDLDLLLTHNREDVLGMHYILPILCYLDFKDHCPRYIGYEVNIYSDFYNETKKELLLKYSTELTLPESFTAKTETLYMRYDSGSHTITFRLPILEKSMRLYYDNYKDYYYLPNHDTCIHKSAAMGLSKNEYVKATKETCYTAVSGEFVKQPTNIFSPALKEFYKDKCLYFSFPDSFDESKANLLGTELINVFFRKRPVQTKKKASP